MPGSRTIYGINPVYEALKAHPEEVDQVLVASGRKGVEGLVSLVKREQIKIEYRTRDEIAIITGTTKNQGVAAILHTAYRYAALDDILKQWKGSGDKAFILVLDGIQDPHNLGSLIRTANAFGVHGIIIPENRAAGITPTVVKISAGATEHTLISKVTNISSTLMELKKEGVWIVGAAEYGGQEVLPTDVDIGLVIGSEGKGLRPLIRKRCDFLVSIPLMGKVSSLNASVAGAVIVYDICRQRGK
ncbi:MAG: 23S rRNA (guanosine(2251)-2'-O)-methyltransferase RlmB [Thermodesulfobacteriota bacterium]